MRRAAALATVIALVLAAGAAAKIAGGKWTGHYGKGESTKVTFTVKGHWMRKFSAFVPSYCVLTNQFTFVTFYVPKARIRHGKVKTTYKIKNDSGRTIGKDHLTAKFSGKHAKGTLSGTYSGCTIAKYHWNAHHGS
jgi:hypothetical protein